MKKFFLIAMLAIGSALFADEAVLIDFTKLKADAGTENVATTLDLSKLLPAVPAEQAKVSLALNNWTVRLQNSSDSVQGRALSLAKEAPSKTLGTVLGVRINFPESSLNSTADVYPPFEVPVFNDQKVDFTGLGLVKNVGVLKSVSVSVYGRNNDQTLFVVLQDQSGENVVLPVGSLKFDGWKDLVWSNGTYVGDVKGRALSTKPSYPQNAAFVKFIGFVVRKDGTVAGGDSIFYVSKVSLIYDKATIDSNDGVDDEAIWSIVGDRERKKNADQMQRIAAQTDLKLRELAKMAKE